MQRTVFMHEGWLQFNREKWGVNALRLRLSSPGLAAPAVETVVYLDGRGHIVMPPLNAYLPVAFHPTPTEKGVRQHRQWLHVSRLLADELKKRGLGRSVSLPPEVEDVRSWQWRGFLAEVRYTLLVPLPLNMEDVDHQVRKNLSKAVRAGYVCATASENDWPEFIAVLHETETRQKFKYHLTQKDLAYLRDALDSEHFRAYTCRGPSGEIASVRAVLHSPACTSTDWVAGTRGAHLSAGATQLLIQYVLDDLRESGATAFDFAGANIPTVSAAKANWGGMLVPYYVLRPPNLRALALLGRCAWDYWRR